MRKGVYKFLRYIRAFIKGTPYYANDLYNMIRYSRLYTDERKNEHEKRLFYSLMAKSHVIEKGLSMPERRFAFGHDALIILIDELEKYINKYGRKNAQIEHIIAIVLEYRQLHKVNNVTLEENLQNKLEKFASAYPEIAPSKQVLLTKEQLFKNVNNSFYEFSTSRRSCRHIEGPAELEKIRKAVKLALNAPSACNKQPVKVHLISSPHSVKQLLNLQQGNRGFGHLIEQVLLITVDIRSYGRYEDRFNPYIDGGLFSMNLLYALHYYKIASIPLVWIDSKQRNEELHNIVDFPNEEYPCLLIGIGEPAKEFLTTASQRNVIDDVLTEH